MTEKDALTEDDRGRWLVATRNTIHEFDLDTSTYLRTPVTSVNVFPYDGHLMKLTRVERWPRIGETFFIWLDDTERPDRLEHWRQSSRVRSITRAPHVD
jgi:hypothetical protein